MVGKPGKRVGVSPSPYGPLPGVNLPGSIAQAIFAIFPFLPATVWSGWLEIGRVSTAFGSTASIGSVFWDASRKFRPRWEDRKTMEKTREELEKAEMEEFNHHRFFVDEKLTEYMKEPKNQLREYHGKEPEGIGPWGRFRTREWMED